MTDFNCHNCIGDNGAYLLYQSIPILLLDAFKNTDDCFGICSDLVINTIAF
jgi:hypothetical protein